MVQKRSICIGALGTKGLNNAVILAASGIPSGAEHVRQVQELILRKSPAQLLPAGCLCSVPLLSPAFTSLLLLCLLWEGKDEAHLVLSCDLGLSMLLLCAGVSAVRAASERGT